MKQIPEFDEVFRDPYQRSEAIFEGGRNANLVWTLNVPLHLYLSKGNNKHYCIFFARSRKVESTLTLKVMGSCNGSSPFVFAPLLHFAKTNVVKFCPLCRDRVG